MLVGVGEVCGARLHTKRIRRPGEVAYCQVVVWVRLVQ